MAKKDESPEAKAAAEEAKWDLSEYNIDRGVSVINMVVVYMFAAVFSVLLVVSLTMVRYFSYDIYLANGQQDWHCMVSGSAIRCRCQCGQARQIVETRSIGSTEIDTSVRPR